MQNPWLPFLMPAMPGGGSASAQVPSPVPQTPAAAAEASSQPATLPLDPAMWMQMFMKPLEAFTLPPEKKD